MVPETPSYGISFKIVLNTSMYYIYLCFVLNRTDVCFHMLQNNQVMGQRHAREILNSLTTNKGVTVLYDKYNMTEIDVSVYLRHTLINTHTHTQKHTTEIRMQSRECEKAECAIQ